MVSKQLKMQMNRDKLLKMCSESKYQLIVNEKKQSGIVAEKCSRSEPRIVHSSCLQSVNNMKWIYTGKEKVVGRDAFLGYLKYDYWLVIGVPTRMRADILFMKIQDWWM